MDMAGEGFELVLGTVPDAVLFTRNDKGRHSVTCNGFA
jgi:hypothetical protein